MIQNSYQEVDAPGDGVKDWGFESPYKSTRNPLKQASKQTNKQKQKAITAQIYNANTWETEAGGSGVQSHPKLYIEFEASISYPETLSQNQHRTTPKLCGILFNPHTTPGRNVAIPFYTQKN